MDRDEFTRRILAMRLTFYRVSYGILASESEREDAVQNAVMKAWQKHGQLRDERLMETWLVRILINECRNLARRTRGEVPTDEIPDRPQAEDAYEQRLRDEGLHQALMRLPEKIRLTMVLFYLDGFSQREICGILRVPAGTVKSRLNQGRKQLKKQLESEA